MDSALQLALRMRVSLHYDGVAMICTTRTVGTTYYVYQAPTNRHAEATVAVGLVCCPGYPCGPDLTYGRYCSGDAEGVASSKSLAVH